MDVYSDIIINHYKHPHHSGKLKKYSHCATEYNPLCGDSIQADLAVDRKSIVRDVGFVGSGCAISQAAMSLLSDWIIGKKADTVQSLNFGFIESLLHVPISPARVSCAMLGLSAVKKALSKKT